MHGTYYITWGYHRDAYTDSDIRFHDNSNPLPLSKYVQSTKYKVQSTKYKVQSTKYKVQSTKYKVQSTKYKVQSTKYKVQKKGGLASTLFL
jgi:hypothetical protein